MDFWFKCTLETGDPVWVNLERALIMARPVSTTIITFAEHASVQIKEHPKQLLPDVNRPETLQDD